MPDITQVGLNMARDLLKGAITDGQIKYIAWGSDATPNPTPNDLTQLYDELGRHAITSRAEGGIGVLDTVAYLAQDDAVENIQEIGFFAGVDATSDANSGIMVSRFIYERNKTNLESLIIVVRDTIEEA